MPKFHLSDPGGGVYEVDAPDEQTAVTAFQKMQGGSPRGASSSPAAPSESAPAGGAQPPAEDEEGWGDYLKGIAQKAGQGLTMGFGDELVAGLKTGGGFLGDYDKEVAANRQALDEFDEKHPIVSAISEIVGGLAVPGGLAKGGLSLIGRTAAKEAGRMAAKKAAGETIGVGTRLANTGRRVGASAVEGAGYGAVAGAGNSEGGLEERAQGALDGGATGAAVGAALPAITGTVAAAARPVINAARDNVLPRVLGGRTASQAAARHIAGKVAPDAVESRIAAGAAEGEPYSVADVGGQKARDLLHTASKNAADREGLANSAVRDSRSAVARVQDTVENAFGSKEGAYQLEKDAIRNERANGATPYYEDFYRQPVTPEIFGTGADRTSPAALLKTPAGRSGLAAAKQNAGNAREPWAKWFDQFDDAGNPVVGKDGKQVEVSIPNAKALKAVRDSVKDAYEAAKRPSDKGPFSPPLETEKSLAIKTVLDDLTGRMDSIGAREGSKGPYALAREVAGENIRADEALEFGRKAFDTHPTAVAARMGTGPETRSIKAFTPDEQRLVRTGAVEKLVGDLRKANFGDEALNKVWSNPRQGAVLRALFPTQAEFNTFRRKLVAEATRERTNAIPPRAAGRERVVDTNDLSGEASGASTLRQGAAFGVTSAVLSGIGKVLRRYGGMSDKTANEVGQQLMARDPREVQRVLRGLRAVQSAELSGSKKAAMIRRIVTDAGATAAGRAAGYQGVE